MSRARPTSSTSSPSSMRLTAGRRGSSKHAGGWVGVCVWVGVWVGGWAAQGLAHGTWTASEDLVESCFIPAAPPLPPRRPTLTPPLPHSPMAGSVYMMNMSTTARYRRNQPLAASSLGQHRNTRSTSCREAAGGGGTGGQACGQDVRRVGEGLGRYVGRYVGGQMVERGAQVHSSPADAQHPAHPCTPPTPHLHPPPPPCTSDLPAAPPG